MCVASRLKHVLLSQVVYTYVGALTLLHVQLATDNDNRNSTVGYLHETGC